MIDKKYSIDGLDSMHYKELHNYKYEEQKIRSILIDMNHLKKIKEEYFNALQTIKTALRNK